MFLKTLNVTVRIKSFHPFYLNNFVLSSKLDLNKFKTCNIQHVYLPQTYEKFTILKSPHVDKKARDQFERKTYNRLLKIKLMSFNRINKKILQALITYFQTISIGVEIYIKYNL